MRGKAAPPDHGSLLILMQFHPNDKRFGLEIPFFVQLAAPNLGRTMSFHQRCFTWVFAAIVAILPRLREESWAEEGYGTRWTENHPDRILIEQLSQSGLHDVAIEVSQRRGSDSSLSNSTNERAHWRMLWMEATTNKLIAESAAWMDNPAALTLGLDEMDQACEKERSEDRGAWIQFQSARCRWLLLRSAVSAYLASPTRTTLSEWSLEQIRDAIEILEKIELAVASIAPASPTVNKKGGPTATEVSSLIADSKLLHCDLLVLRASLYRNDADERAAVGTSMLALLDEAEKKIGVGWSDYPKIEIARCRARLYLQEYSKVVDIAQQTLAPWESQGDRFAISRWGASLGSIAAESLRRSGDLEEASRWLARCGGWQTEPSLAIEHFAIQLARTQSTDNAALQSILELKKEIANRFGPYWSNRADALLIEFNRASPGTSGSPDMPGVSNTPNRSVANELIKAEVRQLLAAKRWEQAIDRLQQAELTSAEQRDVVQAMSFAMQAAALWGLQGDPMTAANEFYRAAVTYPESDQAAKAAMNGIAMVQAGLAKISADQKISEDQRTERRKEWLLLRTEIWKELLDRWPNSEQAATAADSLTEYYLGIDKIDELCELWISRLEKLKSTPSESVQQVASRALDFLRIYAWLLQESWLDSSVVQSEDSTKLDGWIARYEQIVQQGNWESIPMELNGLNAWRKTAGWEFSGALNKLTNAPKWLAGIVPAQSLANQLLNSPPSDFGKSEAWVALQQTLGEIQGSLPTESIADSGLMRSVRRSCTYWQCLLEHFANPQGPAMERLKTLESENPRDPWWTYYAARFRSRVLASQSEAELLWRRLAAAFPAGSVGWLECRARQVQLLRTSGRAEAAQQLAELVLATTPNLDALWRSRFVSAQ